MHTFSPHSPQQLRRCASSSVSRTTLFTPGAFYSNRFSQQRRLADSGVRHHVQIVVKAVAEAVDREQDNKQLVCTFQLLQPMSRAESHTAAHITPAAAHAPRGPMLGHACIDHAEVVGIKLQQRISN